MDEYFVEPTVVNTDDLNPPTTGNNMWENRKNSYYMYDMPGIPKCTIYVQGYNRLNKTKYCVECVLKYTQDVDYELILIDNGSNDGTYDFFQSVPYKNKRILRITKNVGSGFPSRYAFNMARGKYIVSLPNDVYVTSKWLSNLLKCYESDPSIGFVLPLSSNVSNLQELDLGYANFEEMQIKAAAFNKSDPSKWEERMRLISLISIVSRVVFDIIGISDPAFVHDFGEDDFAVRLRRSGFKLMLCKDTWVCHDHDFRHFEDKDPEVFRKTIESGRAIYRDKHHGIDAWDDINNFEIPLLSMLDTALFNSRQLISLAIDPRCGTPVLEIRNRMKNRRIMDVKSYAFTTQAKYYTDLLALAHGVKCDRIDFIQSYYADNTFDIIYLGEPVNTYPSPIVLLQRLFQLLKPGGYLLFKLRNVNDYNNFMISSGIGGHPDPDLPASLPKNDLEACFKIFGAKEMSVSAELDNLSEKDRGIILGWLEDIKGEGNVAPDELTRIITRNFLYRVRKD